MLLLFVCIAFNISLCSNNKKKQSKDKTSIKSQGEKTALSETRSESGIKYEHAPIIGRFAPRRRRRGGGGGSFSVGGGRGGRRRDGGARRIVSRLRNVASRTVRGVSSSARRVLCRVTRRGCRSRTIGRVGYGGSEF